MKLTTKGRHAINAVIDVAFHQQRGPVRLADIAGRERISQSYLELLFGKLRNCRLVNGVRGPGGGYRLAKPMNDITMADIVAAVETTEGEAELVAAPRPPRPDQACSTDALWAGLAMTVENHLRSLTIADVLDAAAEATTAPAEGDLARPAAPMPLGPLPAAPFALRDPARLELHP